MTNNVRIKIRSQIYEFVPLESVTGVSTILDPELKNVPLEVEIVSDAPSGMPENDVDDVIEYTTEGTLITDGTRFEISYEESEEMGMENSRTTLVCDSAYPAVVTMVRSGAVTSSMLFNAENKRQQCSYNTEYIPIELCICTREVSFDMTERGGSINLDYIIELRGVITERNIFSMTVTPIPADPFFGEDDPE